MKHALTNSNFLRVGHLDTSPHRFATRIFATFALYPPLLLKLFTSLFSTALKELLVLPLRLYNDKKVTSTYFCKG